MVGETAHAVIAALGHPFELGDDGTVGIGVSIGIAMSRKTAGRGDIGIVERADAALYEAKRDGKGIVRWHGQKPAHSDGRDLRDIGAAMRELDGSRSPGIRVSDRS